MARPYEIEICLGSVPSCLEAAAGGADRVELCDNLFEGGTTPSAGAIRIAREKVDIEIAVMIRPRGGDFLYSELEMEIMERDIETAIELGADSLVFGLLLPDGQIDIAKTSRLLDVIRGRCKTTFHRAFDVSRDLFESLESLKSMGIDRVLTSGGEPTAVEGADILEKLVKKAGNDITIMAACGITARNFEKLHNQVAAPAYHMTASTTIESGMQFRNDRCFMGAALYPPEFSVSQVDRNRVSWFTAR